LPGGNDLEGWSIAQRFIWNHTIGPIEQRPGRKGTWTGYNTEGLGLLELMTFAEDIGAEPILAVYAGYSLDHKSLLDKTDYKHISMKSSMKLTF
jgi:alpha-L-arabinofuranosidase